MRIVSLVPAATEIVAALGFGDRLVGVSHECDHPAAVRALPRVTRSLMPSEATSAAIDAVVREHVAAARPLYELDARALADLRPDLVITQSLCDVCAVAEDDVRRSLARLPGPPRLLTLSPATLADVVGDLRRVAEAAGEGARAAASVAPLEARLDRVRERSARLPRPAGVVVLEWLDPLFSAGHWCPGVVAAAGGRDLLGREGERSRVIGWDEVVAVAPEIVVVAACGFDVVRASADLPLLERLPGFRAVPAVRDGTVFVIDGNALLSRPGPRLVDAAELLGHLFHPGLHPRPEWLTAAFARRITVDHPAGVAV